MDYSEEIRGMLLELCSEDAWGTWELWGSTKADAPPDLEEVKVREKFIDVIEELIREKKLIVWHHRSWDGKENTYTAIPYERTRLEYEMDHSEKPDPDTFYWFETTKEGKKEDFILRSKKFTNKAP